VADKRFERGQISSPEELEAGVDAALSNPERVFTRYYEGDPTWIYYGSGWQVRVNQANGLIATAFPTPRLRPSAARQWMEVRNAED